VYLPFSRTMHVVLPWAWPSHGSYLSQGLPAVAWVLHESGYPLLVLELWSWSHLSLLFITVLRYWGLSRCCPPPRSFLPMGIGGWHRRCLNLATPTPGNAYTWQRLIFATLHLGDALPWRRLILATPRLGDTYTWRRLKRSTCWLPPLGPLEGSHHMLTLTLNLTLVNTRGRDGTVLGVKH